MLCALSLGYMAAWPGCADAMGASRVLLGPAYTAHYVSMRTTKLQVSALHRWMDVTAAGVQPDCAALCVLPRLAVVYGCAGVQSSASQPCSVQQLQASRQANFSLSYDCNA